MLKRYIKTTVQNDETIEESISSTYYKGEQVTILACELSDLCISGIKVLVEKYNKEQDWLCASLLVQYHDCMTYDEMKAKHELSAWESQDNQLDF